MAKNRDKSGHFTNFPAQEARKLTKSGQILRIFLHKKKAVPIFSQGPLYLGRKSKIGTKSGQFPQMSRIRDSVPKIGTTKGPGAGLQFTNWI